MNIKRIILGVILAVASVTVLPHSVLAADRVERVYGLNRFQTAVQIAFKINPDTVHNVVLTNGYSYADALSGVPLAKQKRAPLLYLGDSPADSEDTLTYIQNHLASDGQIYILGGPGVVSESFISTLTNMGFPNKNIHRLWGEDRYGTAVAVAKQINNNGTEFFLASGENFPDALSGSVLAAVLGDITQKEADYLTAQGQPTDPAQGGVPLLLLPSDGHVPSSVVDYLNSLQLPSWLPQQVFDIIGSPNAIPQATVDELSQRVTHFGLIRQQLYGADRYATMEAVDRAGFEQFSKNSGLGTSIPHVYLATGEDFPDALAGAVLAALNHSPLVLTNNSPPSATVDLLSHYGAENSADWPTKTTLTVLGEPKEIHEATVTYLASLY